MEPLHNFPKILEIIDEGREGASPPTAQYSMEPLHNSPKILEIIDEGREGARKKKGHQPPYLPFLASPLSVLSIHILMIGV
jgi:hypothetical protein